MGREYGNDWRQDVASALEWWRDAGVDTLVEDEPRDWLARTAPRAEAVAAAVAEPLAIPAEPLPDTLEAFVAWRLGDTAPEAEWLTPRIGPAGDASSRLMVLTDMPEADDQLLGGPVGKLFDRMLAAIGESRESIYLASLAVARPLTGQIPPEHEARLLELARHHVALAAPRRLLLLGQAVNRVRSTTSGSGDGNRGDDINHFDGEMVVAIRHPRFLLGTPSAKAEAWKLLLPLSRGTSQ